ncbi:MAG TPA: hypothetical protein VHV51_03460 [Polyangiaceae bacterium]|jgi:hypothetical protein|nr:hypothetical protein [Polyangiaceae bacterium]
MRGNPGAGRSLSWSSIAFALAIAGALAAAHFYEPPRMRGAPSTWFELDSICAVGSASIALGIGFFARHAASGAGALAARSKSTRLAIWAALTVLLAAIWVERLFLLTLLIAPTHALAGLRLLGLWTRWRTERAFANPVRR